jgi:DNA processing protein
VSGLARGIDAEAHLAAAGRTIAVLGQGLYAPMAAWQRELRVRIVTSGGLVVSEFAPEMPGSTFTFPVRNRIIAGLSRGVIVVEAAARSGARNTATHALRLNLEVWAVPGPPDAVCSAGCLDLIEEGVSVFRSSGEVLGRLGVGVPASLQSLLRQPRTLPELTDATGWTTMRMVELLGGLELQGRLARLPGARYGWVDVRRHRSP